jgi:hypothetical protein
MHGFVAASAQRYLIPKRIGACCSTRDDVMDIKFLGSLKTLLTSDTGVTIPLVYCQFVFGGN